jgi:coproporphyrinogen III oxidase
MTHDIHASYATLVTPPTQETLQAATKHGIDRAKGMAPGERVPFFVCGLSSVMHPKNPFCATMHFIYRYFENDGGV